MLFRDNVLDYEKNVSDLKERVFEIIEELLMELETAGEEIRQDRGQAVPTRTFSSIHSVIVKIRPKHLL